MSPIPAVCPDCKHPLGKYGVMNDGGCWVCPNCGYSPCSGDDND